MKKILSFMVVVCLMFSLPLFAVADNRVHVDGADLSLTLTDDYYVFTRETPDDYIGWDALELDRESLRQYLYDYNMYMDAVSTDTGYEILVTQVANEEQELIFDYALYDDEELSEVFDSLREEFSSTGITAGEMEIYKSGDLKYIHSNFQQLSEGTTIYSAMYSTIYNGKAVNFTLHSFAGEIGEYEQEHLRNIVDSVEFDEKLEPKGPTAADQKKADMDKSIIADGVKGGITGAVSALIGACIAAIIGRSKKKNNKDNDF